MFMRENWDKFIEFGIWNFWDFKISENGQG